MPNPTVELTGSAAEKREAAKAEVLSLLEGSPREASHPGPEVPAAWVPLFLAQLSKPLSHCHFLAQAHTLLVDGHGPYTCSHSLGRPFLVIGEPTLEITVLWIDLTQTCNRGLN